MTIRARTAPARGWKANPLPDGAQRPLIPCFTKSDSSSYDDNVVIREGEGTAANAIVAPTAEVKNLEGRGVDHEALGEKPERSQWRCAPPISGCSTYGDDRVDRFFARRRGRLTGHQDRETRGSARDPHRRLQNYARIGRVPGGRAGSGHSPKYCRGYRGNLDQPDGRQHLGYLAGFPRCPARQRLSGGRASPCQRNVGVSVPRGQLQRRCDLG